MLVPSKSDFILCIFLTVRIVHTTTHHKYDIRFGYFFHQAWNTKKELNSWSLYIFIIYTSLGLVYKCNLRSALFGFQICVICKQIHGSCTQCCKCSTYFHAMCASRAGYRMEVRFLLDWGFFFFLQIRLMTDYRYSIVVLIEHLLPLCALRKFRKLTFLCYKKIDKFIRSTVLNVTMYPNSTNGMSLDCCIIECSIYAELPIFN